MKAKLGILGGMGPLATVEFMQKIIARTQANNDQQHIPMLVSNNTQIPDRTAFLIGNGEDPYPALKQDMEQLQSSGVGCIVIPCNTAHYWYHRLTRDCKVHTISIIDSVADEAKRRRYHTVGLLATTATMMTGMYQNKLAQLQIDVIETTESEQQAVMEGIYAVKSGDIARGKQLMLPIFEAMLQRGVEAVIFGCTEIPVALAEQALTQPQQCLDSLDILAEQCIHWAQEQEHGSVEVC